ncbi:MAG: hypothetical protein Q4G27_03715 [Flavobacteriaceae bacterium]|nr:hypothetical protein [Flavobacteriaceae bacterium]
MKKDEYKIFAEDQINDISNRIDELRQRGVLNPKLKTEFSDKVANLVMMRNELLEILQEFDEIPESKWEEAKQEFMGKIDFLKQTFQKLFSFLSR